jgi:hypothetical protein
MHVRSKCPKKGCVFHEVSCECKLLALEEKHVFLTSLCD